jgi:hypothetical protein
LPESNLLLAHKEQLNASVHKSYVSHGTPLNAQPPELLN